MYEPMETWFKERFPKEPGDSDFVYRQTMLAKTCDTLRVLLPAGTRSNLGIYATGQSYEQLLMRLAAHPLAEMREYGELILIELRKVIPEFLKRVDVAERGVAWSRYWKENHERVEALTARVLADEKPETREEVTLTDHDPDGELKIAAAVLYASSDLPDDQLLAIARSMTPDQRSRDPARERRRPGEPAPQARPRLGAHELSVRRAVRLRRVPRPATAPPAHDRVAAPHHRTRLRDADARSTRPACAPTGTA